MIKSFLTVEEPEEEKTGIDWLDVAITIASILVAQIIQEIENRKTDDWQSGNATALNTVEP